MQTIDPKENTEFPFQLDVENGNEFVVESAAVLLESGKGFDVRFPASVDEKLAVTCNIHNIDGVVQLGERKIRLEVVVNGKTYTPIEDSVMIAAPMKISAKAAPKTPEVSKAAPVIKASISSPTQTVPKAPEAPKPAEPAKPTPEPKPIEPPKAPEPVEPPKVEDPVVARSSAIKGLKFYRGTPVH